MSEANSAESGEVGTDAIPKNIEVARKISGLELSMHLMGYPDSYIQEIISREPK